MNEEKRFNEIELEQTLNKYYNDHRATVGSLKKALENFDDELNIGVVYSGLVYTDIQEIFELDPKYNLVILNCD